MKIATASKREGDRIVGMKILDTDTGEERAWEFAELRAFLLDGGEVFCPDQNGGKPTPVWLARYSDGSEGFISPSVTEPQDPS